MEDTGWFELRPITILIGPNASGKTSIIAPLLLLRQTLDSVDSDLALKTQGELFNAGSFENLVFAHDAAREVKYGLRFHRIKPDKDESTPIGGYPPAELHLTFSDAKTGTAPSLKRYEVIDNRNRKMLYRGLLSTGNYSLRRLPSKLRGDFSTAIRNAQPNHFLFDLQDVFSRTYSEEATRRRRPTPGEEDVVLEVSDVEQLYLSIVSVVDAHIRSLLSSIAYIGPIRKRPRRLYELSGERPAVVGIRGEHAPEVLFRQRETKLLDIVNDWVSKFDFGLRLNIKRLTSSAFCITLQRTGSAPEINIADTGFGLSQVLPLIVQGFYARRRLLIAEQPEIHLNPKLQARLADLFVAVRGNDTKVLIETHSEHLVLRMRRLVADGEVAAEDVALYFAERDGDRTNLREIKIQDNGHINLDTWPRGFFEDALEESLALAAAQANV